MRRLTFRNILAWMGLIIASWLAVDAVWTTYYCGTHGCFLWGIEVELEVLLCAILAGLATTGGRRFALAVIVLMLLLVASLMGAEINNLWQTGYFAENLPGELPFFALLLIPPLISTAIAVAVSEAARKKTASG